MREGGRFALGAGSKLAGLGTAGAVVAQLVRLWLAAPENSRRPGPGWRDGCRAAGLGPASKVALDTLMAAFAAALAADLRVAAPTCPWIAADEALILRALALLQRRRHAEADGALARRLPPAALRLALPAAVALAAALGERSLRVALDDAGYLALPGRAATADRGLALLQ